jgi:hypothetical protein
MLANNDPERSHLNQLRSIHVQQVDCCDTDFGHSDDHGTVYRPIKVIKPAIELRVE